MKFTKNEGTGIDGKPWTRTMHIVEGPESNFDRKPMFHPEDDNRTVEEINQDCKELEVENGKILRHIAALSQKRA
jgi:hypothetical protein